MERNIILEIYAFMLLIPNMIPESSFLIQYFKFLPYRMKTCLSLGVT